MQPTKVACPLCSNISIVQDSSPVGRTVTCQQCSMPFMVGPEEIKRAQQMAVPGQVSPSAASAADGWWVQGKPASAVSNPTPTPSSTALRTPAPGKHSVASSRET